MNTKPTTTDGRAVSSPENGRKGGRPKTSVKYAPVIEATEQHLADMLRDDVPQALRDLVRGVLIAEQGPDGTPRIYQRPPDLRAIEMIINRIMGKLDPDSGGATASVVNIIRVGAPDLGV